MRHLIIFFCAVLCAFALCVTQAQVPKLINYQGKLTTPQGTPLDTTVSMLFSIYSDSTSGDPLWIETQPSIKVDKSIFNVLLGSVNEIPESVFTGAIRYMGVKVGDDPEMTPRKSIVSVGYAYNSDKVDGKHASELEGISPNQVYESEWLHLEYLSTCWDKTHNLGTKKLITVVYYAWPDSTSNPTLVSLAGSISGAYPSGGVVIGDITDTTFCICISCGWPPFATDMPYVACNYQEPQGGWLKVIAIAFP